MATTVDMTPGQVFDEVQKILGVGTPDEDYRAWRIKQVSILKATMKRQRLSGHDVLLCARYCVAHRLQPDTYGWMILHLGPAKAWHSARSGVGSAQLSEAISWEHALSDEESVRWLEVLHRATPDKQGEVLDRWRQFRGLG